MTRGEWMHFLGIKHCAYCIEYDQSTLVYILGFPACTTCYNAVRNLFSEIRCDVCAQRWRATIQSSLESHERM